MVRKADDQWPEPDDPPGTFAWQLDEGGGHARRITYICPRGQLCGVPVLPHRLPNGAGWSFDGNVDQPTLSPSVNCVGGCGWHGFITAGRMRNA